MKDYLSYRLMAAAGAAAPLCSYVWITVNGEDWGLYLAVEGVVKWARCPVAEKAEGSQCPRRAASAQTAAA